MNIDVARAEKPPRRLRQLLNKLSPDPDPGTVHDLRTQTRKLEAVLHALCPEGGNEARHILKLIKPVRRAAGRVRDMDVLIARTSGLSRHVRSEGIGRLIEHMSTIRRADAKRLHRKVKRHRKEMKSSLKRLLRNMGNLQTASQSGVPVNPASPQILETLAQKLEHWPRLSQENLHEFRKGVKELHYIFQLVPTRDDYRMSSYAKVKDTVGDWHDWMELSCLAESKLDPKEDAPLLSEIRRILQGKLRAALNAANSLRRNGVEMPHAA